MPVVLITNRALVREGVLVDEQVSLQVPLVAELVPADFTQKGFLAKVNGSSVRAHGLDVVEGLTADVTEELLEVKAGALVRHQASVLSEALAALFADVPFDITETIRKI